MTMGLSCGEYEVSDMHQHTACSHCIETHLRQALEEHFSNGGARTTGLQADGGLVARGNFWIFSMIKIQNISLH